MTAITSRKVVAAWIAEFGADRYASVMARRRDQSSIRDRASFLWAISACTDYRPSLPEIKQLTGFAHSSIVDAVARFEAEASEDERASLRDLVRTTAGGVQ